MASKGFNIDEIRELNKLKIYAIKNGGESEFVMGAYLTTALGDFEADITVDSLTRQMGETVKGLGVVGSLMKTTAVSFIKEKLSGSWGNLLGTGVELTNDINYNFNYRFNGISEFSHTFTCELVVKDDFTKDVINPLWKLIEYVLPDETSQFSETETYKSIEDKTKYSVDLLQDAINNKNTNNPFIEQDILDKFFKYVRTVGGEIGDMVGGLSFIKKPKQLQGGMSHTRITIGDYIQIDNVVINSDSFKIPYLLYDGGLFDKVQIKIGVKGNRKMTLKTYEWVRRLTTYAKDELDKMKLTPLQPVPLNQEFSAPQLVRPNTPTATGVDTIANNSGDLT